MGKGKKALITKETKVQEAMDLAGVEACIVRKGVDIREAVEHLCERSGVRTVAVVDKEERLIGIIPLYLLVDELFHLIAPEEFLAEMSDEAVLEEFSRISTAKNAGDLMQDPVSVTMEDSVRDAFIKMHSEKLAGLPVVDSKRVVVGYLDRLHLVQLWLKQAPSA